MSSDYTIVDITNEAPKPHPLSARNDLKRVIAEWAIKQGLDLGVHDILIDTDEDDDVRIILPDLTLDREGDIVRKTREWTVTAQYTVEVVVTVEASSEDEARDEADGELSSATFDIEWVDGAEVSDVDYLGITYVDEV